MVMPVMNNNLGRIENMQLNFSRHFCLCIHTILSNTDKDAAVISAHFLKEQCVTFGFPLYSPAISSSPVNMWGRIPSCSTFQLCTSSRLDSDLLCLRSDRGRNKNIQSVGESEGTSLQVDFT